MVRKLFTFLLYCLFALCITGVFLVILFPRDRISAWAASAISSRMPGYECSIDDIRYVHPLKIRLYQIACTNEFQGITVPVDTLLLSFAPAFPVETVAVSGVVFGGNVAAEVRLGNRAGRGKLDIENLEVSHLRLDDMGLLEDNIDRPVHGLLSLSGRASLNPDTDGSFRLTGDVLLRDFSTVLRRPIFSRTDLSFDEVTAAVSISSGVVQLSGGQAAGRLLNGDFAGTVTSAAVWRNRTLDFNGSVTVQPALLEDDPKLAEALEIYYRRFDTRSIPFRVAGTLRSPEVSFSDEKTGSDPVWGAAPSTAD